MDKFFADNYVDLLEKDYINNEYYIVANNLVVGDNEKGLFVVVTDNPYIKENESCEATVYAELTKKKNSFWTYKVLKHPRESNPS